MYINSLISQINYLDNSIIIIYTISSNFKFFMISSLFNIHDFVNDLMKDVSLFFFFLYFIFLFYILYLNF